MCADTWDHIRDIRLLTYIKTEHASSGEPEYNIMTKLKGGQGALVTARYLVSAPWKEGHEGSLLRQLFILIHF